MAEQKKYYIHVPGALVEVSEDVYFAYYQEKRRGRTLREKDERNGAVSYDGLDTPELSGQEMIPDRDAVSVEDAAIANILAVSCAAAWPCWTSRTGSSSRPSILRA